MDTAQQLSHQLRAAEQKSTSSKLSAPSNGCTTVYTQIEQRLMNPRLSAH
jgi:hypothetical protein